MRKLLLIALFAVASAAEAQNVLPAALLSIEPLQAPAPAPAAPAQPPAPARPPSAARPAPATAPPAAPAAPVPLQIIQAPRPAAPAANVRFDVTITDTGGPKPVTKTLSLTIGNFNNSGSIRSTAQVPNTGPSGPNVNPFVGPPTSIPLNVDVRNVMAADNNAVRANVLVEYQPYVPDAKSQPGGITASAQTVFFDGRKTQILVTSDPISDRKTTIEVTATILK